MAGAGWIGIVSRHEDGLCLVGSVCDKGTSSVVPGVCRAGQVDAADKKARAPIGSGLRLFGGDLRRGFPLTPPVGRRFLRDQHFLGEFNLAWAKTL